MPKRKSSAPPPAQRAPADLVRFIDEAVECCVRIATIAQLLDACDETRLAEAGHNAASHAGSMILAEIGKLRRGLDSLDNAARPDPILPIATARRIAKISPA